MNKTIVIGISAITVVAFLIYVGILLASSWPIEDFSIYKASLFGDSFGIFASFFSGLAFIGLLYTIYQQGEELKLQREEMSKSVATQIRQLHYSLLSMAMTDKSLEAVWEETREISGEPSFKQKSYVNLIISHWEMQFEHRLLTEEQLNSILSVYMPRPHFQKFWEDCNTIRSQLASSASVNTTQKFHELLEDAYNNNSLQQTAGSGFS